MSTPESSMARISGGMILEFAYESSITRKLLERVPENLAWKPHEKSMSLGRLATHIAEIAQWAGPIVTQDSFDMGAVGDYKPVTLGSRAEILDTFQKSLDAFNATLQGKSDEVMIRPWRFLKNGQLIVEHPRVVALRSFVLSHVIHHRGQLSVYLRLNNVPVPAIYGPSADES
jgi:uncharacterized damage-inducible protein DinB